MSKLLESKTQDQTTFTKMKVNARRLGLTKRKLGLTIKNSARTTLIKIKIPIIFIFSKRKTEQSGSNFWQ